MRGRLGRVVVAGLAAALALAALHFLGGLDRVGHMVRDIRRLPSLGLPVLGTAATLDLCAALLLGLMWARLLQRLGHRVPVRTALMAALSSSLAGYVDSLAGSAAGAAVTLRRRGVTARRAALVSVLAYMLAFCGILVWAPLGLLVVERTHVGASLPLIGKASTYALAIMLAGMIVAMPVLLHALAAAPNANRPLARRLLGHVRAPGVPPLRLRHLLLLIPWSSAAWLCGTLALLVVIAAIHPAAARHPVDVIGAGALANVLGALAFFMPEGLGVRDGVLLGLLAGAIHLSLAQATVAVIALRAIDACTKLGLLIALYLVGRLARCVKKPDRDPAGGTRSAPPVHRFPSATPIKGEAADEAVA